MSKAIIGVNDLQTFCIINKHELLDEWDYEKNAPLLPKDFAAKSNKKVWWKCKKCGESWSAAIVSRTKIGSGCPYCAGNLPTQKYNLKTQHPSIVEEWNFEKNYPMNPEDLLPKSNKKVWWKCKNGHEWEAQVNSRTRLGAGCPYCSGNRTTPGVNDVFTLCASFINEWDYEKNIDISPKEIGVAKKVWWKCSKGHSWSTTSASRLNGNNCPYCSGRLAIKGENDLETLHPELAKEWNYEKNGDLKPSQVKLNSHKKVWWKCKYGHEWEALISDRSRGNGCPICSGNSSSLVEQGVAYYLSLLYRIEQRIKINGYEVDIFLPDYQIAVEYDGVFYHKEKDAQKREEKKNMALSSAGISLYRIKETYDIERTEGQTVFYKIDQHMGKNYCSAVHELINLIGNETGNHSNVDINIERDLPIIRERFSLNKKERSFASVFPEKAKEWDYEKNHSLTPEMFSYGSSQKVWWRCSNGHEWVMSIHDRASGSNCPYCANRKLLAGYNDLETIFPSIANEWDYEKNAPLSPKDVLPGTHKKAWWKCPKGHSYQAIISNRTEHNSGCPYCANLKLLVGYNDLETIFPSIANEWDYEKNAPLLPKEVLSGTHKKVWWKCKTCGHEWYMEVSKRTTTNGRGCPKCGRSRTRSKLSKKVINIDTGQVYSSIKEAKEQTGIDNIGACCSGKYKTAGGFRWKYYNDKQIQED